MAGLQQVGKGLKGLMVMCSNPVFLILGLLLAVLLVV